MESSLAFYFGLLSPGIYFPQHQQSAQSTAQMASANGNYGLL